MSRERPNTRRFQRFLQAVKDGDLAAVETVLSSNADWVHSGTPKPLFTACASDHDTSLQMVEALLRHGANPMDIDTTGDTTLMRSWDSETHVMAKLDALWNAARAAGRTATHLTAWINATNEEPDTLLYNVVFGSEHADAAEATARETAMRWCLDRGADPHQSPAEYSSSPISYVVRFIDPTSPLHLRFFLLFQTYGDNAHRVLQDLVLRGDAEVHMLQFLHDHGARPELLPATALAPALATWQTGVVDWLLNHGTPVQPVPHGQANLMTVACRANFLEGAQRIYSRGWIVPFTFQQPNPEDELTWTPLVYAARWGNTTLLRWLWQHGIGVGSLAGLETALAVSPAASASHRWVEIRHRALLNHHIARTFRIADRRDSVLQQRLPKGVAENIVERTLPIGLLPLYKKTRFVGGKKEKATKPS